MATPTILHRFPYPYTSVSLGFGLLILTIGLFSQIDVFELPSLVIPGVEPNEMAEIVIAFLLSASGPALAARRVPGPRRAMHEQGLSLVAWASARGARHIELDDRDHSKRYARETHRSLT
jgi:hypothetical protein